MTLWMPFFRGEGPSMDFLGPKHVKNNVENICISLAAKTKLETLQPSTLGYPVFRKSGQKFNAT